MEEIVVSIDWYDLWREYRAQTEANRIKYAPKVIKKFDLDPICKFHPKKGRKLEVTYRDYAIYQYRNVLEMRLQDIALIFGISLDRVRQIINRLNEKVEYSRIQGSQYKTETRSIDPTIGPMNYGEWQAWDTEAQWREIAAPEGPPN